MPDQLPDKPPQPPTELKLPDPSIKLLAPGSIVDPQATQDSAATNTIILTTSMQAAVNSPTETMPIVPPDDPHATATAELKKIDPKILEAENAEKALREAFIKLTEKNIILKVEESERKTFNVPKTAREFITWVGDTVSKASQQENKSIPAGIITKLISVTADIDQFIGYLPQPTNNIDPVRLDKITDTQTHRYLGILAGSISSFISIFSNLGSDGEFIEARMFEFPENKFAKKTWEAFKQLENEPPPKPPIL